MKVEQAKQIANKAVEELGRALERGHSETLRTYLSAMSKFRTYSLRNVMLIASQRPSATRVAGYHTWKKLGRQVKKGATGILILAPITIRKSAESVAQEEGSTAKTIGFRAVYVFDVADTEGQPLPELGRTEGNPSGYSDRLKDFVSGCGIQLEYSDEISPALGRCLPGKIVLMPGLSPAEEFATLAHEVAHSLLHRTARRTQTSKRVRETEAEAVAYVVCAAIGLKAGRSADYIQLYSGDKETLAESLQHVQNASTQILHAITPDH